MRLKDNELVSTAEHSMINKKTITDCQNLDSLIAISNWIPGDYEIHRMVLDTRSWFGSYSIFLPVVTINVTPSR